MNRQNKLKDSLLRFLHDLFDLMVVNWLWVICCLPVITVGPATCGLYTVTLKLAREEPVSPVKDFFRGFRSNFKAGLVLGLIAIGMLIVATGDIWFALQQTGSMRSLYLVVGIIVSALWLTVISYTFALQAMFDSPLKLQLLNAFKLAFVAPGRTIGLWLILMIPVIAVIVLPPVVIKMLGFLYLVAGISGPVYWASHIQRNIFDRVNGRPTGDEPPTSEES